jgi:hypothetical protein
MIYQECSLAGPEALCNVDALFWGEYNTVERLVQDVILRSGVRMKAPTPGKGSISRCRRRRCLG